MIKTLFIIFLTISTTQLGCTDPDLKEYSRSFYTMGSSLEIRLYTDDKDLFYNITEDSIKRADEINNLFSNYTDDSILAGVNSRAGSMPVEVPPEFSKLTRSAIYYSELTNGAFDITVGNMFELWKGKAEKNQLPEKSEIEAAFKCTGYGNIKISQNTISYGSSCLKMDYGAIGKGYVVDEILEIIRSKGIQQAIINFGGNIYSLGSPADQEYWEIGINNPSEHGKTLTTIGLKDYGIATSGDYEKYFEIKGKRYSHIINPVTGMPVKNISSVTVAAKSATEADALSTAFSVMGLEKTKEFIQKRPDIAVMFVEKKGDESEIFKSALFSEFENNLN